MNENSPTPKCPRCDATLPADAPEGLCPRCLIALNFAAQTGVTDDAIAGPGTAGVKPPPPPAPAPEAIAKLFPQLEVLELLGRGGMGAVYKARQPKLDRFVALKILLRRRGDGATDPAFSERFAREARALARLNHPAIVAVHEYGEAGGYPYLLMEYVDGLTLRQLLQHGRLAPEEALAIVPKICEALQFAHQRGIVHRDIKPENLLVDKQGEVRIADFGIAKILAPGAQDRSLTGGQDVVGTPHYMAPEQVERPAKVDHRADIFSLGVVFYEMLTGELPLGKFAPPSRKVQVDVRLDQVVLRALEKEPERRYQQASQVKTDVETIASDRYSEGARVLDRTPGAPTAPQAAADPQPTPKPNRWEVGIIASGLTVYAFLLVLIPTVATPVNHILAFLCVLGLSIGGLTLAGWWPAPSFLVPDSGFARRNLHRVEALSRFAFVCACSSGLLPAIFYWLAPWLVPGLTPQGREFMGWLALGAAFVAFVTGLGARQTRLGQAALVVGALNLSLCVLFLVAGSFSSKPLLSPRPSRSSANHARAFGPVIERELRTGLMEAESRVLDLDDGRVLSVPAHLPLNGMNNPRPLLNWMAKEGADLLLTDAGRDLHLHLDDGRLVRLGDTTTLDSVPATEVERQLARTGGLGLAQNLSVSKTAIAGAVFAFRTREGAMGVLQLHAATGPRPPGSGPSAAPSSATLRYRLAQAPSNSK